MDGAEDCEVFDGSVSTLCSVGSVEFAAEIDCVLGAIDEPALPKFVLTTVDVFGTSSGGAAIELPILVQPPFGSGRIALMLLAGAPVAPAVAVAKFGPVEDMLGVLGQAAGGALPVGLVPAVAVKLFNDCSAARTPASTPSRSEFPVSAKAVPARSAAACAPETSGWPYRS